MNAPLRKRDRVFQLFRRVKAFVGLGKSVREAADELIDDNCDIDEPVVPGGLWKVALSAKNMTLIGL